MEDPNEELWNAALAAMNRDEDLTPLSELLANPGLPLPWRVRAEIARLMAPEATCYKDMDPKNEDRIVFARTDAMRGKIRTNNQHIADCWEVLKLEAKGMPLADAIAEVAERLRCSESRLEKGMAVARKIPDIFKPPELRGRT
jgi:hypothetical protein